MDNKNKNSKNNRNNNNSSTNNKDILSDGVTYFDMETSITELDKSENSVIESFKLEDVEKEKKSTVSSLSKQEYDYTPAELNRLLTNVIKKYIPKTTLIAVNWFRYMLDLDGKYSEIIYLTYVDRTFKIINLNNEYTVTVTDNNR